MSRMNVDRQSQYRTGTAQSGGGVRQSQQPMVNPAMYQSVSRPPLASAANGASPSSQADVSYRPKTPSQLSQFIGGSPQRPSSSMNSLLNPNGNNSGRQRPYNTMEINPFKDLTSGQQSNQPAFRTMEYNYQRDGASNAQAFMPASKNYFPRGTEFDYRNEVSERILPRQLNPPTGGTLMRQAASRVGAPVGSAESNKLVDRINSMSNSQLDSFLQQKSIPENKENFRPSSERITSAPISVVPGSPQVPQRAFAPDNGLPPSPQSSSMQRLMDFDLASSQPMQTGSASLLPGNMNSLGISYAPRSTQPSNTTPNSPQRSQVPPPQAVSVPYSDEFVGPYSAERALADFNAEAARLNPQPRESFSDFVNQAIEEGVAQGQQQGVTDANKIVDQNLAGSQGFYATPSQRRSGFFTQSMGVLPSDAALMAEQNQPPRPSPAADAAAANQSVRKSQALMAMGGPSSDGLTRYMPNQDLVDFANAGRPDDNQLKAMTPAEIQFYRHKKNMAENPVYAERINAKREARSADLANQTKTRLEMAANRRQAAADAAGASQQLRNFMAGRGAIGGGQDGFNALMSLAAMQNPNQAFSDYGQAYQSLMAPEMQSERLGAQERMYGAGLKNELDLQAGQLGFNRDELKAREGMYGTGIKSQQDMQTQEIASRERMGQLQIGAQQSDRAAQRAFEQAQQATNFEQRKQLEELGQKYRMEAEDQRQKFEKESRDFQNRASIIAGADSSYDAREGLALYGDPDKYLDPQKNPGVDIPAFQPSQGAEGNRQQTYFEILDWAARNGLSEDNYRVQQELKKNQATPTPQEAEDWQSDIWWSQPMIGRYNYSPLAPSYQQQDLQRRYQDRLRKFIQPSP